MPNYSYVTTHNTSGQAVFSKRIPELQQADSSASSGGRVEIYTSPYKPDLSTEDDIEQFSQLRTSGFPPGKICTDNGVSVCIVTIPGGDTTWKGNNMHRTMTIDTVVVIEGAIECLLDSGESRTLYAGDAITQRGTMHKWKNVTPDGGGVKLTTVMQPIQAPLSVGGLDLGDKW